MWTSTIGRSGSSTGSGSARASHSGRGAWMVANAVMASVELHVGGADALRVQRRGLHEVIGELVRRIADGDAAEAFDVVLHEGRVGHDLLDVAGDLRHDIGR